MDFNKITSSHNPKIKELLELRERSQRDKSGLTLIEGVRETACALKAKVPLKEVYVCKELLSHYEVDDLFQKLRTLKIKTAEISESVYAKLAYGERKDGILAVGKPASFELKDFLSLDKQSFLVVEGVEKPGNLGAIFRVADAAGIDGIIICDEKTDLYNPNVIRASLGTVFAVRAVVSSNDRVFNFLKTNGIKTYVSTPFTETIYSEVSFKDSLAIVVGSEDKGVSEFWMNRAYTHLKIPMRGEADSLNVAASTAILLYEVVRQRAQKGK